MRMKYITGNHRHRGVGTASLISLAALTFLACADGSAPPAPGDTDPPPQEEEPKPSTEEPNPTTEEPTPPGDEPSPTGANLVTGRDAKNAYLLAVGSLNGKCTGSIIKTSEEADAPAYVLTAGHCARYPFDVSMYFDVGINEIPDGDLAFRFNYFNDIPVGEYVRAAGRRIAYVTMKGADLALIELAQTLGELKARGVEPLPLASAPPAAGEPIEIAGIPLEHDGGAYTATYVRRARCAEGSRRPDVVEHNWHWYDMHVNDCRGMGLGASGGPALDKAGRVFGIYTSHFRSVEPLNPCYLDYPCEVGGGEPERGVEGASYVVDTTGIARCFNSEGRFALTAAGCKLDRGGHAQLSETPSRIAAPTQGDPATPSGWAVKLSPTSDTHYRYKVGPLESVDCRSAEGYTNPIRMGDYRLATLPVPAQEGLYALCLVTGSGEVGGAAWQSTDHPTVVIKKVREVARVESGPGAADVTTEQAFDLASQVVDIHRAHAAEHQARFLVNYGAQADTKLDIAADRTWHVHLGVTLLKHGVTPPDVAALIACHEVGHALGGFPFQQSTEQWIQVEALAAGQFGTVSSAEGQADYFATKECLPRLWASEREVNARFRETVTEYAKTRCDAAWADVDAQNLCYRLAAAAEGFGRWRGDDPMPDLSTPDTREETVTNYDNPSPQCRVDTMFQGALCGTKFRGAAIPGLIPPYDQVLTFSPEVEAAAAPDSCTEGPGARPRCWFAPNSTAADCTGIPETGKCDEVFGQPAVVTCSPQRGIETFTCPSECTLDEDGWAACSG